MSSDSAVKRKGRRNFLKVGLLAAVGLGVGLAAATMAIPRLRGGKASKVAAKPAAQQVVLPSSLGSAMPLKQVGSEASFAVSAPSYLPPGTAFSSSSVTSDGGMVTLLYAGGSSPLSFYQDGVSMAVYQIKETVITGPPSYLPADFVRLAIHGNPGFGQEPLASSGQPGQIQWWSGGRRISIFANLSVSELTKVADSMEAGTSA